MKAIQGELERFCPLGYYSDCNGTVKCWDNRLQKERYFSLLEWKEREKEMMLLMKLEEDDETE